MEVGRLCECGGWGGIGECERARFGGVSEKTKRLRGCFRGTRNRETIFVVDPGPLHPILVCSLSIYMYIAPPNQAWQ